MKENKLDQYRQLVSFLGQVLGPDYEVVLSDLHSILAISNGQVSGRSVGGPLRPIDSRKTPALSITRGGGSTESSFAAPPSF